MNLDQNFFEKIEGYLNQSLNTEDRVDFERQMDADPKLKQEFELHRSLQIELSDTDTLEFRKKVVKISGDLSGQQPKKKLFPWKIAASLLVLLGLSTYLWLGSASSEDLFETYYNPFPVEDMVRGERATDKDAVLQHYSIGNYTEIVTELERISTEDPTNETILLYLGNCYLNLDQEHKAINVFNDITDQSKYYENAQWYLALTYIKQNKNENAVERLNWLIKYDGVHKKNAIELLNKLED